MTTTLSVNNHIDNCDISKPIIDVMIGHGVNSRPALHNIESSGGYFPRGIFPGVFSVWEERAGTVIMNMDKHRHLALCMRGYV